VSSTSGDSSIAKALALIGFPIACAATSWLLFFAERPHGSLALVCWKCAIFCGLGSVVWSWSTILAYLARKWKWDSRTCLWLTLCFYGSGLFLLVFANSQRAWSAATLILLMAFPSNYLIRKLAFPESNPGSPFK
jgi:hypothetical protein